MSKKLYEEVNIQGIAEAIREKNGTQNQYTPAQMAGAVRSLHTDPVFETLSVTENGLFVPRSGVDGFSEVNVNVQGGLPILQEKTATRNGIILPDTGYDGLSKVTVNVEGGSSNRFSAYDWDFRESLIDSISGAEVELHAVTRDENGLLFNYTNSYVTIPSYIKPILVARLKPFEIEVDIGDMNLNFNSSNIRFIMADFEKGFIYRSSGVWGLYNGSWAENSSITDKDYFSNSILRIIIDSNNYWHIYKNNDLVYEPNRYLDFDKNQNSIFGSSSGASSSNKVCIKGLRIHAAQAS